MNIWHDIDKKRITPQEFIAVIEIPKGERKKFEIDKETGMLYLDRILKTSMVYPANYGFLPRTLSEDGDPLDVILIMNESVPPMTLVKCKPLAVIEMVDNGERDEKIIAVPSFSTLKEPEQSTADEIIHFLKSYKALQKDNKVEVKPLMGREKAIEIIKEAIENYNKKFGGKK